MPDEKKKNYRLNYKDVIQETIDRTLKRQQYLNSLLYSSDKDDKELTGFNNILKDIDKHKQKTLEAANKKIKLSEFEKNIVKGAFVEKSLRPYIEQIKKNKQKDDKSLFEELKQRKKELFASKKYNDKQQKVALDKAFKEEKKAFNDHLEVEAEEMTMTAFLTKYENYLDKVKIPGTDKIESVYDKVNKILNNFTFNKREFDAPYLQNSTKFSKEEFSSIPNKLAFNEAGKGTIPLTKSLIVAPEFIVSEAKIERDESNNIIKTDSQFTAKTTNAVKANDFIKDNKYFSYSLVDGQKLEIDNSVFLKEAKDRKIVGQKDTRYDSPNLNKNIVDFVEISAFKEGIEAQSNDLKNFVKDLNKKASEFEKYLETKDFNFIDKEEEKQLEKARKTDPNAVVPHKTVDFNESISEANGIVENIKDNKDAFKILSVVREYGIDMQDSFEANYQFNRYSALMEKEQQKKRANKKYVIDKNIQKSFENATDVKNKIDKKLAGYTEKFSELPISQESDLFKALIADSVLDGLNSLKNVYIERPLILEDKNANFDTRVRNLNDEIGKKALSEQQIQLINKFKSENFSSENEYIATKSNIDEAVLALKLEETENDYFSAKTLEEAEFFAANKIKVPVEEQAPENSGPFSLSNGVEEVLNDSKKVGDVLGQNSNYQQGKRDLFSTTAASYVLDARLRQSMFSIRKTDAVHDFNNAVEKSIGPLMKASEELKEFNSAIYQSISYNNPYNNRNLNKKHPDYEKLFDNMFQPFKAELNEIHDLRKDNENIKKSYLSENEINDILEGKDESIFTPDNFNKLCNSINIVLSEAGANFDTSPSKVSYTDYISEYMKNVEADVYNNSSKNVERDYKSAVDACELTCSPELVNSYRLNEVYNRVSKLMDDNELNLQGNEIKSFGKDKDTKRLATNIGLFQGVNNLIESLPPVEKYQGKDSKTYSDALGRMRGLRKNLSDYLKAGCILDDYNKEPFNKVSNALTNNDLKKNYMNMDNIKNLFHNLLVEKNGPYRRFAAINEAKEQFEKKCNKEFCQKFAKNYFVAKENPAEFQKFQTKVATKVYKDIDEFREDGKIFNTLRLREERQNAFADYSKKFYKHENLNFFSQIFDRQGRKERNAARENLANKYGLSNAALDVVKYGEKVKPSHVISAMKKGEFSEREKFVIDEAILNYGLYRDAKLAKAYKSYCKNAGDGGLTSKIEEAIAHSSILQSSKKQTDKAIMDGSLDKLQANQQKIQEAREKFERARKRGLTTNKSVEKHQGQERKRENIENQKDDKNLSEMLNNADLSEKPVDNNLHRVNTMVVNGRKNLNIQDLKDINNIGLSNDEKQKEQQVIVKENKAEENKQESDNKKEEIAIENV